jgi:hypothetical protein
MMFDYAVAIDWMDLTLGCRAIFTIEDVCWDQWNWVSKNPYGYKGYPADSNGSKVHNGTVDPDRSSEEAFTTWTWFQQSPNFIGKH